MQQHPGNEVERARVFCKKYPEAMEQCPVLFERACRRGLDMDMLEFVTRAASESDDDAVGATLAKRFLPRK